MGKGTREEGSGGEGGVSSWERLALALRLELLLSVVTAEVNKRGLLRQMGTWCLQAGYISSLY